MQLKKLSISLSFCLFFTLGVFSHHSIKNNPKDTIAYNEENTQKVLALGDAIQASIHNNQPDVFLSKFYTNVFFKRILDLNYFEDSNDKDITAFLSGIKEGLSKFPIEITNEVQNGSYYNFIKYRYDQEHQTYFILFRLYSLETGMNYHDFRIHKKDGEMQFSDIYMYTTGENLSETISRLMSYTLPKKKILGLIESPIEDGVLDLMKVAKHKKVGDFEKAYQVLDGITSRISKDKFFLIFKSLIASNVDDDKYLQALEELMTTYPDDPTIALNKIDYLIYKGNYFEAIQIIDFLQEDTEDDFLNFMKANVAFQDENYDFALNNYKYIIENYANFFEGQAGYLSTLVMQKKFSEATNFVDSMIADGYEKEALIQYIEEDDDFGENILQLFVESKEYKNWKLKTPN